MIRALLPHMCKVHVDAIILRDIVVLPIRTVVTVRSAIYVSTSNINNYLVYSL